MARAYGSSAHLLMKRKSAYGQAATGNYLRMPFNPVQPRQLAGVDGRPGARPLIEEGQGPHRGPGALV
jgi:hypothetical protein